MKKESSNEKRYHGHRSYWYEGTWVFDDPEVNLVREPFVSGVPEMINELVDDIVDAHKGFRMAFSAGRFPGFQREMTWVREEDGDWLKSHGCTS